jgi:3-phosphoglycerate kinase
MANEHAFLVQFIQDQVVFLVNRVDFNVPMKNGVITNNQR